MITMTTALPTAAQLQHMRQGIQRWLYTLVPPACASWIARENPQVNLKFTVPGAHAIDCVLSIEPDPRPGVVTNLLLQLRADCQGVTLIQSHYDDLVGLLASLGLEPFRHTSRSLGASIDVQHNVFVPALP